MYISQRANILLLFHSTYLLRRKWTVNLIRNLLLDNLTLRKYSSRILLIAFLQQKYNLFEYPISNEWLDKVLLQNSSTFS